MMKAAIYCRLSEEDRNKQFASDDSASIQNQKTMLLQYAVEHGWEVFDIYSDDDYAGADRRRPAFNRLLRDAEARKFNIILCKTQSRFTRELELVEKYIHGLFPLWGIRFISIVDNADTANKGNKKSRQINALVNEWYLEDMSENIRSVLTIRRQNGLHIGAFALYGYEKDPQRKGHLIIDAPAAAVVREVFTLFSQGYGKSAIARMLNDRGIPNPTEYKRLKGSNYRQSKEANSTLWRYSAISHMLTNEMYIGNMVQGKYGSDSYKTKQNKPRPQSQWYCVAGTHEPIIHRQLWDTVQLLIRQKAKPFAGGTIGLFARKARCAHCGYTLRSTQSRGRHYLQCPLGKIGSNSCIGAFIAVEKLENMVRKTLNQLLETYLDKEMFAQNVQWDCAILGQMEQLQSQIAACRRMEEEYTHDIRKLYADQRRGILPESDYLAMTAELANCREQAGQSAVQAKQQLDMLEAKKRSQDARSKCIETYTNIPHLTRPMVELLIDHICVGRRITGSREVPVSIYWRF